MTDPFVPKGSVAGTGLGPVETNRAAVLQRGAATDSNPPAPLARSEPIDGPGSIPVRPNVRVAQLAGS